MQSFGTLLRTHRLQCQDPLKRGPLTQARLGELLGDYLQVEQMRLGKDLMQYQIDEADEVESYALFVPTMIIQPFVENAIEHGKVHLAENGKIWVRFKKSGASYFHLAFLH